MDGSFVTQVTDEWVPIQYMSMISTLIRSLEDVHTAIATLEAANFENWSVDLIGGLPGQVS